MVNYDASIVLTGIFPRVTIYDRTAIIKLVVTKLKSPASVTATLSTFTFTSSFLIQKYIFAFKWDRTKAIEVNLT